MPSAQQEEEEETEFGCCSRVEKRTLDLRIITVLSPKCEALGRLFLHCSSLFYESRTVRTGVYDFEYLIYL